METINFLFTNKRDLPQTALDSLNSFIEHNHKCILWTYYDCKNVPQKVEVRDAGIIEPLDESIEPEHFADYWRLELLLRYGGWWSDLDNICIKSLSDFKDEEYVFTRIEGIVVNNNIIKTPKNSKIMWDCFNYCQKNDWKKLSKYSLNFQFMSDMIGMNGLIGYVYPPEFFIGTPLTNNTYVIHKQGELFK